MLFLSMHEITLLLPVGGERLARHDPDVRPNSCALAPQGHFLPVAEVLGTYVGG
jgi:hypothetical protein